MIDKFGIEGTAHVTVVRSNGKIERFKKHNMITASGYDSICDILGNGAGCFGKIKLGTGSSETTQLTTDLEAPVAEAVTRYSHIAGTLDFELVADFGEGDAAGSLCEAGVYTLDGKMIDRVTFDVVNLSANDKVSITFVFSLS